MAVDTAKSVTGEQTLVDGPAPRVDTTHPARKAPAAAVAARLLTTLEAETGDLIFLASSERRADELASALGVMASGLEMDVLVLPPWDCLPYDRAPPSRESMGRRMAVLAALQIPSQNRRVLVTSPEAAMQRTPPDDAAARRFDIAVGERIDRVAMEAFALSSGYVLDERIDEPGEIALLGAVIDVFPPAQPTPFRIALSDDGEVTDIKAFDPVSQRTEEAVARLCLTPASELVVAEQDSPVEAGDEHRLPERYDALSTIFDRLPDAALWLDAEVEDRVERFAVQVAEAFETRVSFGEGDVRPLAPDRLYISVAEMRRRLAEARTLDIAGVAPPPTFALSRTPGAALKAYIEAQQAAGRVVILTGLKHEQRIVARLLKRSGAPTPDPIERWADLDGAKPGALVALEADLDAGFDDPAAKRTIIAPSDITGGRIARRSGAAATFGETELRVGDVVIHEDHGLGVLQALERIEADGAERDVLRLEYHGGATILAPVEEFGRIWRYGSEPAAVTLDRLNTQGWIKRRAEVSAQIDATAATMVEMARARAAIETPPITPPATAYRRFVAGFPFPESADQSAAISEVLADLASGRPMNRLVCGDVGFGKTEVALRAAAATALAGRQVLVAAPTTVLARQHYESFRRRFEGTGVTVGHLSRLVDGAEARAVKAGLADGSVQIVVGTQALAADSVAFADLTLVVIDEEHRFGARLKQQFAERAPHLLLMSATPIPRTLQSALVGIQDVSLIASPPARRRPIRTFLTDFDPGSARLALMRENARGGQSFVVAPRIEDLEPLAKQLSTIAPELKVVTAHGKLPADEMDSVMTGFADGDGDVLLATNIIENGLDVPRANTMLIWRPDRFGLAQLHQLRGRVGRGRRQGFAYLLSDPAAPIAENTRSRLQTLEALDRLGSGFAISARDLDLRGGGDLVGDEQAGHIRLIGASLYQRVLGRALRLARGEGDGEPARPKLNLASGGSLPDDYVPDATVRINLYARLAQLSTIDDIDALHEEIADRFGPLPDATETLLTATRLAVLAMAAGITEIASGPKATAFTITARRRALLEQTLSLGEGRRWSSDRLIVDAAAGPHDPDFVETVLTDLAGAG